MITLVQRSGKIWNVFTNGKKNTVSMLRRKTNVVIERRKGNVVENIISLWDGAVQEVLFVVIMMAPPLTTEVLSPPPSLFYCQIFKK